MKKSLTPFVVSNYKIHKADLRYQEEYSMQYYCMTLLYTFAKMKLLTLIWALYLAMLSFAPCSDADNSCEDVVSVQPGDHNHNGDRDDNCTPFCHCSCCSINIAVYNFNLAESIVPMELFVEKKVTIRKISHTSDYSGNIWQPPKISA